MVRGAWKTDTEYIHKLRIERYQNRTEKQIFKDILSHEIWKKSFDDQQAAPGATVILQKYCQILGEADRVSGL